MPAVTHPLPRLISEYGRAVLLALLLHSLLLALLLSMKLSPPAQLPVDKPIPSYLYQPSSSPPATGQQTTDAVKPGKEIIEKISPEARPELATASNADIKNQSTAPAVPTAIEKNAVQDTMPEQQVKTASGQSLVQRALKRVAKPDNAIIDQAATASYQQFLQKQQPRLTVAKKHWPVGQDPATQVVVQLDNGWQVIRTKDGCRIADPSLDGFAALMAARAVPCGDEITSNELLKQALQKHSKR